MVVAEMMYLIYMTCVFGYTCVEECVFMYIPCVCVWVYKYMHAICIFVFACSYI